MLKLGWAAGRVLAPGGRATVLVGKDTRISGYMFESALEAGFSAAGVNIRLLGPMPTPGIAYLTRALHAQAGIVISASHNPHYDNGVKFFSAAGEKLPDAAEMAIEAELDLPMKTVDPGALGKVERVEDAPGRYIEFCKSTIPGHVDLQGMRLVVDCAHGATYHIAPHVLEELGAKVFKVGVRPNGLNINDGVGSMHPQVLRAAVLKHQADAGIALDGDGDRAIMIDRKGELVDGDQLLYIIARLRRDKVSLMKPVVGTQMSNLGLERALGDLGIAFRRAAVGDRYVLEMLRQNDWVLGGESSGHIICLDRTSTGDGIVTALQVLGAMVRYQRGLHELKGGMEKFPQRLVNVRVRRPFDLDRCEQIHAGVRAVETELGSQGRVLLRASGTEPVVRVMVEGRDEGQVGRLAEQLASLVNLEANGAEH
jgi:phosphoglucosamine mutase